MIKRAFNICDKCRDKSSYFLILLYVFFDRHIFHFTVHIFQGAFTFSAARKSTARPEIVAMRVIFFAAILSLVADIE